MRYLLKYKYHINYVPTVLIIQIIFTLINHLFISMYKLPIHIINVSIFHNIILNLNRSINYNYVHNMFKYSINFNIGCKI